MAPLNRETAAVVGGHIGDTPEAWKVFVETTGAQLPIDGDSERIT